MIYTATKTGVLRHCLGHLQEGFRQRRAASLTRLAMPDGNSLLGTTSPLLNSEGLRMSCGCGAVVSEHLTGDALMRDGPGLSHL